MKNIPPKALKLLEILKKMNGRSSVKKIEEKGMAHSAIMRSALWLKENGFLKISEEKRERYILSKKGLEAYKDGLPEKKLLNSLKNKTEVKISDLRMKNIEIGVAQAKKLGWISIEKKKNEGFLKLTKKGSENINKKSKVEDALELVKKGYEVKDKNMLKYLIDRGLIKKDFIKEVELELKPSALPLTNRKHKKMVSVLEPKDLKNGKWKKIELRPYDVKAPVKLIKPGKKHIITQTIEYIRKIWLEMGFKEMVGPILDTNFWVFDALYQPQDHPARDLADTLFMKVPEKGKLPGKELVNNVRKTHENGGTTGSKGWGYKWDPEFAKRCVLRTHTTSLSAHTLAKLRKDVKENSLPAKYFSVGRNFRNETLDWKHLIEFYQTDGIVVDESVNFRIFLFYLKRYFAKLGFPKVRFRPAYFPYTELSTEIEVLHPGVKKWLELGGAGIFRPEVVKPLLGRDIPVLAWGPGFERMLMIRYGIKDIRKLYENNLKDLRDLSLWGVKCLQ